MTKEDIKVGAYYINTKNLSEFVYFGVGKRVMYQGTFTSNNSEFIEKDLIILNSDNHQGQKVQSPEDSIGGFWDSFEEISRSEAYKILGFR